MNSKRNKRIWLCASLTMFIVTGCMSEKEETPVPNSFVDKYAINELEDGWVEYLYINVEKNDKNSFQEKDNYDINNITGAFYNVVNLKKFSNGESKIPIVNEKNEVVDQIDSDISSYVLIDDKKNAVLELNDYLSKKKFKKPINVGDLKDFNNEYFDKQHLVELYNQALKDEPVFKNGNIYTSNKEIGIKNNPIDNGGSFRIGFIVGIGLEYINIEYLDEKDQMLSDICTIKKATTEQMKAQETIEQIEKEIIDTQELEVLRDIAMIEDFKVQLTESMKDSIIVEKVDIKE